MPELPEVEIVKRSLLRIVNKAKIKDIKVFNKKLRYKISNDFSDQLINEKIIKITRRSKYLIFHFKEKILLLHLGMTGKLLVLRKKDNEIYKTSFYYDLNILPQHNHVYFFLNNGFVLIYNDVRRFGYFKYYFKKKLNEISFLKKLGPEPLGNQFNYEYFKNFIKSKKKNIKSLLMDQTFVSGLGNIYVNEALFMSKINPLKRCRNLDGKDINQLIKNIKSILKKSIKNGGSTVRDFKNSSGKSGSFQQFFKVYGRKNKECSRISCSGKINKILIQNRATFYCFLCQT
jgi:formamidopyrimidine-DNA glycosylase